MDFKEKPRISAKLLAIKPVRDNVVLTDHFRAKFQMFFLLFFFFDLIEQQSLKLSAL